MHNNFQSHDALLSSLWHHHGNFNWVSETQSHGANIFLIIINRVMLCKKLNDSYSLMPNCRGYSSVALVFIYLDVCNFNKHQNYTLMCTLQFIDHSTSRPVILSTTSVIFYSCLPLHHIENWNLIQFMLHHYIVIYQLYSWSLCLELDCTHSIHWNVIMFMMSLSLEA